MTWPYFLTPSSYNFSIKQQGLHSTEDRWADTFSDGFDKKGVKLFTWNMYFRATNIWVMLPPHLYNCACEECDRSYSWTSSAFLNCRTLTYWVASSHLFSQYLMHEKLLYCIISVEVDDSYCQQKLAGLKQTRQGQKTIWKRKKKLVKAISPNENIFVKKC